MTAVAGYAADGFESRYWPMVVGLITLGVSTALLCVGNTIALWIVGRLLQGTSAAVVWTVGLALLVDTVGKEGLGVAMGYIGMSLTFGFMSGPLLGGVLYGRAGYYGVFGLAFGLIGVDIILRVIMIEKKDATRWIQGQDHQPTLQNATESASDPENLAPPSSSQEKTRSRQNREGPERDTLRTSETPPEGKKNSNAFYTLLASERMLTALWAYFVISVLLSSFDSVLPLFVKDTFGWGKVNQGLTFLALTVPHVLDPLIGGINDKFPQIRRYLAAGGLFTIVPPIVIMRLVTDDSTGHKVLLCAMLVLAGTCLASLFPPVLVEASYVVQEKEEQRPDIFGKGGAMAISYGLLNIAYAAGTIVGPFFAGYIRQDAGWGTLTWALALLAGVSGVPVLLLLGGSLFKRR